ncbi:MAG: phosphonate C-P lyase system protein PhnG [Sneathiellaceae bacterium]
MPDPESSAPPSPDAGLRRSALAVLARATPALLADHWLAYAAAHGGEPAFTRLRGPETGLTMVRGRMGGTGQPFSLGETTVTRCTLRLAAGQVGTGYVLGRDRRQAEIAALVDALLQDPARRDELQASVIAPLAAAQARRAGQRAAATDATKVEFFTLVRGEDA